MDRDIQGSLENLSVAEGIVGHHWVGIDKDKYANPAKKVMYNFAPKLDGDIIDAQKNLKDTEGILEHEYQLSWKVWDKFTRWNEILVYGKTKKIRTRALIRSIHSLLSIFV